MSLVKSALIASSLVVGLAVSAHAGSYENLATGIHGNANAGQSWTLSQQARQAFAAPQVRRGYAAYSSVNRYADPAPFRRDINEGLAW